MSDRRAPRWLAIAWEAAGIAGMVVAVVGGVALIWVTGSWSSRIGEMAEITQETVAAVESSLVIAADAVRTTQRTVEATIAAMDQASDSLREISSVSASVVRLMNEGLPAQIEAVRAALDGLIDTAGIVDDILSAGALLGLDYDPDIPLDQALRGVDDELAGLGPILETESESLLDATRSVVDLSVAIDDIAPSLQSMLIDLRRSEAALVEYSDRIDGASEEFAGLSGDVAIQLMVARIAIALFALLFAALSSRLWWDAREGRLGGSDGGDTSLP